MQIKYRRERKLNTSVETGSESNERFGYRIYVVGFKKLWIYKKMNHTAGQYFLPDQSAIKEEQNALLDSLFWGLPNIQQVPNWLSRSRSLSLKVTPNFGHLFFWKPKFSKLSKSFVLIRWTQIINIKNLGTLVFKLEVSSLLLFGTFLWKLLFSLNRQFNSGS